MVSNSNNSGFFSTTYTTEAKALLRLWTSSSDDKWAMRELVRGLLGKAERLVRVLKDFQASSVSLVRRDFWRFVSREFTSSRVRVLGDSVGRLAAAC